MCYIYNLVNANLIWNKMIRLMLPWFEYNHTDSVLEMSMFGWIGFKILKMFCYSDRKNIGDK